MVRMIFSLSYFDGYVLLANKDDAMHTWFLNSSASFHITHHCEWFSNYIGDLLAALDDQVGKDEGRGKDARTVTGHSGVMRE